MADTVADLAYEASTRALSEQRAALDNLRSRAATLVSAAAIVTSFMGASALADQKLTRITGVPTLAADRSLQTAELVAILAFGGVLAVCLWILRPRANWIFVLSAKQILGRNLELDAVKRELAEYCEEMWDGNARPIKWRMRAFQVGVVLLGVEAVAWLVDLT